MVCVKSPQSCPTLLQPYGLSLARLFCPGDSPGKNIGVGFHILLQGIFLTQGSKLRLILPTLAGGLFTASATWEAPMEYYSATKKNEIMPLEAAWMDLEIVILSEISQTKTNII